jgi:cysteine desulfuration protein SufE
MSDLRSLNSLTEAFSLLPEWEERYRYVIDLGRQLEPLPAGCHTEAHKVHGCASQVWFDTRVEGSGITSSRLFFRGDSDALIVRGLIAILFMLYSGKTAGEILAIEPEPIFARLGLDQHLSPQRSNGLRAMVERIRSEASKVLHPT